MRIPESMRVTTIELNEAGIANDNATEAELREFIPKCEAKTEQDGEVLMDFFRDLDSQREKLASRNNSDAIGKSEKESDDNKQDSDKLLNDEDSHVTQNGDEYFLHKVTSNDTIQGIILRYGVDFSSLRKLNDMTSDRLTSYSVLKIPKKPICTPTHMKPIETTSSPHDVLLHSFKTINPELSLPECRFYLSETNWVLERALQEYQQDRNWEKQLNERKPNPIGKDYDQIRVDTPCLNRSFFGFNFNRSRRKKYKAL